MNSRTPIVIFTLLIICISSFCVLSCGPTSDQIEARQLRIVDSVYYRQLRALNVEMDSICDERYEDYLQKAIDSIERETWAEIRKLRNDE